MSNETNNVHLNNKPVYDLKHLKLGMLNINYLSKWKRGHIDMVNMTQYIYIYIYIYTFIRT